MFGIFTNMRAFAGGLGLGALALFFLIKGLNYEFGEASRMGPGYFPITLSIILLVLAAIIILRSTSTHARLPSVPLRPLLFVFGSIGVFALSIRYVGLLPAMFLTVTLAAMADRRTGLLSTLMLAAFMTLLAWLIFSVGLGMPIPLLKVFA